LKIVIDTSVLIAAALGNKNAAAIFDLVKSGDFDWIATPLIIKEYKQMLRSKKFKFDTELINLWLKMINESANKIDDTTNIKFSSDPKDSIFINCANVSEADYLITEDKLLLKADHKIRGRILNKEDFIKSCF
jgi:putative PIN family toxin of toxin-antitoxin system